MNGLKLWIPLVPLLVAGALGAGSRSTRAVETPENTISAVGAQPTVQTTGDCPFAFGCFETEATPND